MLVISNISAVSAVSKCPRGYIKIIKKNKKGRRSLLSNWWSGGFIRLVHVFHLLKF